MTIINSTPNRLDMQAWGYRGASVAELRQVNSTPGELYFQSSFDPYAFASVPQGHTYVTQLRIRGEGFGDFDASGVPRIGTVTGATLANNFGFVVFFQGLSMPVAQFLAALSSTDPAELRRVFLAGNDQISGGTTEALIGLTQGDHLRGEAGNDTLSGGGGLDTLDGGPGDDMIVPTSQIFGGPASVSVIVGGDGTDTLSYEFASAGMEIDLGRGVAGRDTISGIERVFGTAFDDRIVGAAGDDELFGAGGADTILGGAGADRIDASEGVDRLSGEAGDDLLGALGEGEIIDGGDGFDLLNYSLATRSVVVNLSTGIGTDTVSGVEWVVGSRAGGDSITGSAGADTLQGGKGAPSTVSGGAGDDGIFASGYLRGDDGADTVTGGATFDDINGNMGNDVAYGMAGDDWVVGGKDNDILSGGDGADIVYGNLGSDSCSGDAGADLIRGGQNDDTLSGGAGDDWLSGDRGGDIITGGAGADIFHSFAEADADIVNDFNAAEGDRVMLDPGTVFTVLQVGADTVVQMGQSQLILTNVSLASLPQGWIFGS